VHGNARLTAYGRWLIVERHLGGMPLAHVADQLGISRQTASKWWQRYLNDPSGEWWKDRPSTPRRVPNRIAPDVEAEILELRRRRLGPWQIAKRVGVSSSTVWRVLRDAGMNRLGLLDPPTGEIIRYERAAPGELIHIDTKKFGRIPNGGGRWALGDIGYRTGKRIKQRVGYIHVTPLSMTTPGLPTQLSTTTPEPTRAPSSLSTPSTTTPHGASASKPS